MTDTSRENLVGALVNGIAILRYLQRAKSGVGASQTARDLNINPSTCFNLLKTLVHEKLARFDPTTKTYALSIGVVSLAQTALDRENHIRTLHPELQNLANKFGVAMNLFQVIEDNRVLMVDRAEPNSALQLSMRIGQRLPMFTGAFGRCFAAKSELPKSKIETLFKRIRSARPIPFAEWFEQVEEARERGFAYDRGNYALGITTVAVIITNSDGKPFLAVSAIGITDQISDEMLNQLGGDLLELARCSNQSINAHR